MEQDIRLDQIHLDREHLRQELDPVYIRELADSIKTNGLLQAIVVRAREGGGWRLVAGRCRLAACTLLEYITIPARISESDELDEILGIDENMRRKQMNPLEEARAVQMLHEKKGLSQSEIAERLRRGTSWVQDRLWLCTIPENFQKAIADKKLTIGGAGQLLQIADEEYRNYLLSVAIINGATVNQCQAWLLDYQARSRIMNPTGAQPIEPRLPMEAPEPLCTCDFCSERVAHRFTVLLRFCHDCNTTLAEVRRSMAHEATLRESGQEQPSTIAKSPS